MADTTMRAVQFDGPGGPEVLRIRDVPIPAPTSGQVLVRVHAASVNPADVASRRTRLGRFPRGTGMDYAGEVAEVGPGATDLRPGQRVWGYLGTHGHETGAAADYLLARREQVAAAPASVDSVSAAALPTVGTTALEALRDKLRLRSGQRLLVVGASGGVGGTAVQLGRAMGASVTAVASARNADLCRELGADRVIDYASTGADASGREFDALLDCHGAALRRYRRLLLPGGRAATIAVKAFPYALWSRLLPGPGVRVVISRPRRSDMEALAGHVDRGELRPVVERVYPLVEVQEAHRAVETGHARGKRVLDLRR
ncbi:NAD(P)-dependent alcohol dehydrogenase [Nocardiopsis sp. EMB25]|uniref:NAD(P)-dependent alcohol dehydrogenase n=1 Tax=Nocardiopsis sp. EMB25 TaxID=2835867 RepID=UPI002283D282|nr:NAD(P)-dependent alcohol dehydrogenase [Nocardiopsis sp. EMB25]MCY9786762.1 NAD(P)-dependent alcohol dehydrogenase [Nocardiopsis sp. EMB25]